MRADSDISYPASPPVLHWWSPFTVSGHCGEVTVLRVDLSDDADRQELAFGWLDRSERSRCERYLPEPRRHFVLCRAALRAILCRELQCSNTLLSFGEGPYGKPFAQVEGRPAPLSFSFSVSHSGRFGLIAHSRVARLGIDVEQIRPTRHLPSLIEAVMGTDEREELEGMTEEARLRQFFRLWTCKEALVKALGTGFSTDVSGFQVTANIRRGDSVGSFRFPHLPTVVWRLEAISGCGFAAALASEVPSTGAHPIESDYGPSEFSPARV